MPIKRKSTYIIVRDHPRDKFRKRLQAASRLSSKQPALGETEIVERNSTDIVRESLRAGLAKWETQPLPPA